MPVSVATDRTWVTHPRRGTSLPCNDDWGGHVLIDTGRDKVGDQRRTGPDHDVAKNRRAASLGAAS